MSQTVVTTERKDEVAVVKMDDGRANALSHEMIEQLLAALDDAEGQARAVLIVGRPGRFCAGFDLRTMLAGIEVARKLVVRGAELYLRLYEYPAPVVMACTGHAMAGGAVMLLTGDTRFGTKGEYKIGLNEISIGMPLPVFVQELARDRLDPRQLTAATLQAQIYTPEGAVDAGFLDRVVMAQALEKEALAAAKKLAALPTEPYGLTKQRLRETVIRYVRDTLALDMARITPPQG